MARRIVDHLGDYDWDGSLADAAREICTLLSDADYRDIAYCFWQQYLSLPATQAIRHLFHEERLERRMRGSIDYARLKYGNPFDEAWVKVAHRHADVVDAVYVRGVHVVVWIMSCDVRVVLSCCRVKGSSSPALRQSKRNVEKYCKTSRNLLKHRQAS